MTQKSKYNKGALHPSDKGKTEPKKARDLAVLITVPFFIAALIGILNHEMWRDEYQAWLIARDAHSLRSLYQNCLYEGHPMLWHFLLYLITSISNNIMLMQGFNLLLATASVYLFNKYAPMGWIQKILFSFGYYTFYEYTVISRYHALGLLLVLVFCVLYRNKTRNTLWLCIVLFLLANTSIFDLVVSFSLSSFFAFDLILNKKNTKVESIQNHSRHKFYFLSTNLLSMLIVVSGITLSVLQIMPEKDNYVQASFSSLQDMHWMKIVISKIFNAYTLLPELKILPLWDLSGRLNLESENLNNQFLLSILLLIACTMVFMRKLPALILYLVGMSGLLLVYGIVFLLAPRYIGHTFIVFVAAIWLSSYVPEHHYKYRLLNTISGWGKKSMNVIVVLIFGSQIIPSIFIYITDLKKPFSASKQAAAYILAQKLDTLPLIGSKDYVVSSFSALLNKPIYFPERKEEGTFILWDQKRNDKITFNEVIAAMDSILLQKNEALLIMNTLPTFINGNQEIALEHDVIDVPTGSIKLDILSTFEKSMVADEKFYIYLAQKNKPTNSNK